MTNKQPLVLVYNDESVVDTLVALYRADDPRYDSTIFVPIFPSVESEEEVKETIKEATKDKDFGHIVCNGLKFAEFEDEENLPKVLEILSSNNPEYWALNVAWEHLEHDLSTEAGIEYCKALLDSKVYGTETEDESQKWNALWQTINLGNTMCMALANSYHKGGRDGTDFCDYIVSLMREEQPKD